MNIYRHPDYHYGELRHAIPRGGDEDLIQGYQKLSKDQILDIAHRLGRYGITPNDPAINISSQEEHAAQKWIAEKKKQITELVKVDPDAYNKFGVALGLTPQGTYNIRQSGNLTRVAAALYNSSDFKQEVHRFSEIKKERRHNYLERHPRLQANLKALHYAERPIRNELYELEQLDRAEFPEAATYLKGHSLNYRQPTVETMQKIAEQNAIPVFPQLAHVPDYIKHYASIQQNPPQMPAQGEFYYDYVQTKKGKPSLPKPYVEMLENANMQGHIIAGYKRQYKEGDSAVRRVIRNEIKEIARQATNNPAIQEEYNQHHRFAQPQMF